MTKHEQLQYLSQGGITVDEVVFHSGCPMAAGHDAGEICRIIVYLDEQVPHGYTRDIGCRDFKPAEGRDRGSPSEVEII